MVYQENLRIQTRQGPSFEDITSKINDVVSKSGIKQGIVNVFLSGTTAAILINENESGLKADLELLFEEIIPEKRKWNHNATWGEGNAHSHLRSLFIGGSLTIPLKQGSLTLGTWQSILLLELDVRSRERNLVITVIGA